MTRKGFPWIAFFEHSATCNNFHRRPILFQVPTHQAARRRPLVGFPMGRLVFRSFNCAHITASSCSRRFSFNPLLNIHYQMSQADVPLAQVRVELEKLGFRDLPEHLLVSFMQSILSEEAATAATCGPCLNVPSAINEARDTNFLRSNGAISTQSAAATHASVALKTRVSGRKVTILSPSKVLQPAFYQTEIQEDQQPLSLRRLQQQDAVHQEQQRKPTTANSEEQRTSPELVLQNSVQNGPKSLRGIQQKNGFESHVVHSVPSAHMSKYESAPPAASVISGAIHDAYDENSVPVSERHEAANNALRAAISCKSSSLRSHSSSSSVIFASAAPSRPRSRHDPVKAFQNHVSFTNSYICICACFALVFCVLLFVSDTIDRQLNGRPLLIHGYLMLAPVLCNARQSSSPCSHLCRQQLTKCSLTLHRDRDQLYPAGESCASLRFCRLLPFPQQLCPATKPSSRPSYLGNSRGDGAATAMVNLHF